MGIVKGERVSFFRIMIYRTCFVRDRTNMIRKCWKYRKWSNISYQGLPFAKDAPDFTLLSRMTRKEKYLEQKIVHIASLLYECPGTTGEAYRNRLNAWFWLDVCKICTE